MEKLYYIEQVNRMKQEEMEARKDLARALILKKEAYHYMIAECVDITPFEREQYQEIMRKTTEDIERILGVSEPLPDITYFT